MERKYTDRDFLKILRDKAGELGRTPKRREVRQNFAISARFGSWNNALKAAGLNPLKKRYTIEEYYKILRDWAKKHGKTPRSKDFAKDIYLPDPRTICRKCGMSWNGVIKAAGWNDSVYRV